MHEYDIRKWSRTRQVATVVFFIALGVALGVLLDPDNGWQSYLQPILIGAIGFAVVSIVGGYQSYPETIDEYRRYRPLQNLLIAVLIGIVTGITVYVLHDDPGFAVSVGVLTTLWLFVVTIAGTWVVRRVTDRGNARRNDDPLPGNGETRSSYDARIGGASRRTRPSERK